MPPIDGRNGTEQNRMFIAYDKGHTLGSDCCRPKTPPNGVENTTCRATQRHRDVTGSPLGGHLRVRLYGLVGKLVDRADNNE